MLVPASHFEHAHLYCNSPNHWCRFFDHFAGALKLCFFELLLLNQVVDPHLRLLQCLEHLSHLFEALELLLLTKGCLPAQLLEGVIQLFGFQVGTLLA